MEITILEEEENPMLHRTDVCFRVSHAEDVEQDYVLERNAIGTEEA